jgi:hypothetical protein
MNYTVITEITRMLNAFPTSKADPDLTLDTFEMATSGLSSQAVIEAAQRFTMGDVQGQSTTFAPSVAEFVEEARQRQEYMDLKARPRLPAPSAYTGTPWHVRQEKARTKYRECPIIKENVSYDEFRKMSAAREIPVGGAWVAALATVFGPPAEQIAIKGRT